MIDWSILHRMPITSSRILNLGEGPERPRCTLDAILEAKRRIEALGPPPDLAIDLYGHPTITEVYMLDMEKALLGFRLQPRGRRMMVAPKARLQQVARALREAGADVRIEPRYGAAPPENGDGGTT